LKVPVRDYLAAEAENRTGGILGRPLTRGPDHQEKDDCHLHHSVC
jgi:hypothetical protein